MTGREKTPLRRRKRRHIPAQDALLPGPELLRTLGRRVREARLAQGRTRQELAHAAGLSLRYLAALEAGKGNISILRLRDLLAVLGMGWQDSLVSLPDPANPRAHAGAKPSPARRRIERLLDTLREGELDEIHRSLAQRFEGDAHAPVALLGLRGAGKTSVGRRLARGLGLEFAELDDLVESAAGLDLQQIFELQGPERYRELERAALERYLRRHQAGVLATGGGIVTEPRTFALLRRHCLTVWLRATPEEHWERVVRQGDRRPMQGKPAAMQELRALLAAREPLYGQARIVCDTRGHSLAQVAKQLEAVLRERGIGNDAGSNHPIKLRGRHFE